MQRSDQWPSHTALDEPTCLSATTRVTKTKCLFPRMQIAMRDLFPKAGTTLQMRLGNEFIFPTNTSSSSHILGDSHRRGGYSRGLLWLARRSSSTGAQRKALRKNLRATTSHGTWVHERDAIKAKTIQKMRVVKGICASKHTRTHGTCGAIKQWRFDRKRVCSGDFETCQSQ